ncbi:MAG: carboxylating nicotinate-nucleotide diphosphorylase [Desulfovibrio sp.]|nr:carboxylating nicotinate-nucleotide diphosphorylase [Desulfovibrio sp.]
MFTPWIAFFSPEGTRLFQESLDLALAEDGPDLTAEGIFASDSSMRAVICAKENTLVAGLPIIGLTLKTLGQPFRWQALAREGARIPAMTDVALITAPAVTLLKAERVILNYITRLSGIANLTSRYARKLEGTGVRLLDTRKTTPCLRWVEKYAVQVGGGQNHRMNLTDMLMLKDNHIDAAGSIIQAVATLRSRYKPCPPIEVECRTLEHVREAITARANRIMMDNMEQPLLSQALALVPLDVETEVSGGVTLDNIRAIALTRPRKPDFISVGRLTHSAMAADFSMTILPA